MILSGAATTQAHVDDLSRVVGDLDGVMQVQNDILVMANPPMV